MGYNKFHHSTSTAKNVASISVVEVTYKPGKEMHPPDKLSRAYLNEKKEDLLDEKIRSESFGSRAADCSGKAERTSRCHNARQPYGLKTVMLQGWPDIRRQEHPDIHELWLYTGLLLDVIVLHYFFIDLSLFI